MVSYRHGRKFDTKVREISKGCLGIVIPSPIKRDWNVREGTEATVIVKYEEREAF